jgi:hypothetical protein
MYLLVGVFAKTFSAKKNILRRGAVVIACTEEQKIRVRIQPRCKDFGENIAMPFCEST